jgi:hypothetical protein
VQTTKSRIGTLFEASLPTMHQCRNLLKIEGAHKRISLGARIRCLSHISCLVQIVCSFKIALMNLSIRAHGRLNQSDDFSFQNEMAKCCKPKIVPRVRNDGTYCNFGVVGCYQDQVARRASPEKARCFGIFPLLFRLKSRICCLLLMLWHRLQMIVDPSGSDISCSTRCGPLLRWLGSCYLDSRAVWGQSKQATTARASDKIENLLLCQGRDSGQNGRRPLKHTSSEYQHAQGRPHVKKEQCQDACGRCDHGVVGPLQVVHLQMRPPDILHQHPNLVPAMPSVTRRAPNEASQAMLSWRMHWPQSYRASRTRPVSTDGEVSSGKGMKCGENEGQHSGEQDG